MFWFQYEYLKSHEIFKNFLKIYDYSIFEILVLIIWTTIILASVFYIIPFIKNYIKNKNEARKKKEKKKIIDRIVLQKNLEDLVMREVNEKNVL